MIEDLFKYINQSNLTIIGYDSNREFEKDLILDKLNSYHINDYVNFDSKKFIRDSKLNHILHDTEIIDTNFFHLDIDDIKTESSKGNIIKGGMPEVVHRNIRINEIIKDIRFNLNISETLIITTKIYKSTGETYIRGGNRIIYSADLLFYLDNDKIKITKNRYSYDNIDISLSDLENFNYLCDYEFNK
jgi:hypothetical protein